VRRKAAPSKGADAVIDKRARYEMIARMAYFRAEKRNFEPGWELEDWLESERMIDRMLESGGE
jgi:PHD/YefM family antitoxin component YafN of YafNO toxin-antitoxin module